MASGSLRPRDLLVADVSHEDVPEAVLGVALHRAAATGTDELLASELMERMLHLALVAVTHLGERAGPEHLADHSGVLEQALPVRGERVEAGGDQRLERLGHRSGVFTDAAVGDQAHELLGVQGVPARPLQQCLLRLGRENRALEQSRDQTGRLLVREWSKVDPVGVLRIGTKGGVPLEELRAGGTEHEQRHPLRPFGEMLEKGEKGFVRPVQILEDEDRLPRFCPPFEDAAPGRKRLLLGGGLAADADERRQTSLEPREVGIVLGERSVELGVRLLRRVGLENPALGLHDLPERPEGDPLSIGKATALAPARKRGLVLEMV